MKVSPYVCRLRLAEEIADIRQQAAYTSEMLYAETGIQRQKISHIETANRRVDPAVVRQILSHLSVPEPRCAKVMRWAQGSARPGWWERFDDEMGPRQARTADLEQGATAIFQYQPFLVPGLLQTQAFAKVRAEADRHANSRRFSMARMLEARTRRQAVLSGPDAIPLQVVIDEAVIRRRSAPRDVMREQLDHLIGAALNQPSVTVRILPFSAEMEGHIQARTAFSRYTYGEADDPVVVVVDTNVDDLIFQDRDLEQQAKVIVYTGLEAELERAALNPVESIEYLTNAAEDCLTRR